MESIWACLDQECVVVGCRVSCSHELLYIALFPWGIQPRPWEGPRGVFRTACCPRPGNSQGLYRAVSSEEGEEVTTRTNPQQSKRMNEKYGYNLSPGVFSERLPWDKTATSFQEVLSSGAPNQAITLHCLSHSSAWVTAIFTPQIHITSVPYAQCDCGGTRSGHGWGSAWLLQSHV